MSVFKKILVLFIFVCLHVSLFAQTDTVLVPDNINGDYYGAINKFIADNPNHGYYKLEVGKYYQLNAAIEPDWVFRLIADKPDPSDPAQFPAVVAMGNVPNDRLLRFFILSEDAYFENIYFLGSHPTLNLDVNVDIEILKEGGEYVFDGCYFDWCEWLGIMVNASNVSVTIKNTLVKNFIHPSSPWNARFLSFQDNPADTVIMTNNTYFSSNFVFLDGRTNIFKYLQFEHNSLINFVKWPIQHQWPTDAKISNNLYYNAHSMGENAADRSGQDFDGLLFGLVNADTLLESHGIDESDRKVHVKNNNWFYSKEITDYWDSFAGDGVEYEPFMNTRTQAMFDADNDWPGLIEENTINLDPGFTSILGTPELAGWMIRLRNFQSRTWWFPDADGNRYTITWPLQEDLSYTNATILTGAEGGFPIGDLNWFGDDKVKEWEDWLVTDIEEFPVNLQPKEYTLGKNYPNPFNPTTTIDYSIVQKTNVNISVHNILGQKLATLINKHHVPGSYKIDWNGKDEQGVSVSSGLYFYKMNAGDFMQTGKMVLMK